VKNIKSVRENLTAAFWPTTFGDETVTASWAWAIAAQGNMK